MHRLQVWIQYNIIYTYYDNTANILNIIVPREWLHEYRYLLDILISPYFTHVCVDYQQIFAYIVSIRPQALTDHIPVSTKSKSNTESIASTCKRETKIGMWAKVEKVMWACWRPEQGEQKMCSRRLLFSTRLTSQNWLDDWSPVWRCKPVRSTGKAGRTGPHWRE